MTGARGVLRTFPSTYRGNVRRSGRLESPGAGDPGVTEPARRRRRRRRTPRRTASAAFFDLDRTLMEGSSAFAVRARGVPGRADLPPPARRATSGRTCASGSQGSTDEGTDELRERVLEAIAGQRASATSSGWRPEVLAGILPPLYPQMLEVAFRHQDAGRRCYIVTAASPEIAELLAHVLTFDGGIGSRSEVVDGTYTGRPGGPFVYREGKAEAIRTLAAARGHRPVRLLRVLGLGVRPPDDARRGSPRGREPGRRARAGGPRGGVGGHALRDPGAPAQARRRGRRRAGRRRDRPRRLPPPAPPARRRLPRPSLPAGGGRR